MKTKNIIDIKLGNHEGKSREELEQISKDFNEEQERLFNERVRGGNEK